MCGFFKFYCAVCSKKPEMLSGTKQFALRKVKFIPYAVINVISFLQNNPTFGDIFEKAPAPRQKQRKVKLWNHLAQSARFLQLLLQIQVSRKLNKEQGQPQKLATTEVNLFWSHHLPPLKEERDPCVFAFGRRNTNCSRI